MNQQPVFQTLWWRCHKEAKALCPRSSTLKGEVIMSAAQLGLPGVIVMHTFRENQLINSQLATRPHPGQNQGEGAMLALPLSPACTAILGILLPGSVSAWILRAQPPCSEESSVNQASLSSP